MRGTRSLVYSFDSIFTISTASRTRQHASRVQIPVHRHAAAATNSHYAHGGIPQRFHLSDCMRLSPSTYSGVRQRRLKFKTVPTVLRCAARLGCQTEQRRPKNTLRARKICARICRSLCVGRWLTDVELMMCVAASA